MSKRLEELKLVKGQIWERQDSIDNIGVSTYDLIRDAIREEKFELAKGLVKYLYFWEVKFVRDANIDLVSALPQFYMTAYGEDGFGAAYREVMTSSAVTNPSGTSGGVNRPETPNISNVDWAMDYAARMVRPHRMGKNDGWDGFVIEEYADRVEFLWDPCYTGGRTRRGDPISGQPPHNAWPYNYAVNQLPHDWTWGKIGVSSYCIHCCLFHELMDIEKNSGGYIRAEGGYFQQWNCGYYENHYVPCRYVAYKNVDWIPEFYYKRVGKTKPAPLTGEAPPENPNKLIRTSHSDELGERYINTARLLWEAIDSSDVDRALYLLDYFDAETKNWHASYPIRWNWTWISKIAKEHGYDELYRALMSCPSPFYPPLAPNETKPQKEDIPCAEERAKKAALWGRGDRAGKDRSSVNVYDEGDKIVVEFAPCGSCGRCISNAEPETELDQIVAMDLKTDIYQSPQTSLTRAPYNFGVTTQANHVAWNKVGVPEICARCCVSLEHASVARSGYLCTIVERPENDTDPNCRWLFYKELDDIPEEYYNRIGKVKPPVTEKSEL